MWCLSPVFSMVELSAKFHPLSKAQVGLFWYAKVVNNVMAQSAELLRADEKYPSAAYYRKQRAGAHSLMLAVACSGRAGNFTELCRGFRLSEV